MTDAVVALGTDFRRGDAASPEVFTSVGEILSINGMSITRDMMDATTMDSPDGFEAIVAGIKRTGVITVEVNFVHDSTAHETAITDVNTDVTHNYRMVFPDATTWEFAAYAQGFEMGMTVGEKITGTFTYKPTGKPAFLTALES